MKFNFKYLVLLLTAFVVSCTTAEYEEPGDISTIGFYNSKGQDQTLYVGQAGQMTFSDLSQGAIGHSWTIEKGNFFLEGPFLRTDNYKVFEQKIINPGDTVTGAKTAIVYFKNTGLNKVRLYNEFKDSVTFPGYNKATEKAYTLGSHKVGNKWVIDTTFVVNVLDSIVPAIQVSTSDGQVVDHTLRDTLIVEAGDPLLFENKTTIGDPNRTLWQAKRTSGGNTIDGSNDNDFNLVLKSLGFYNVTLTLNRIDPVLPQDSEFYRVPLVFKVIPSSKPFIQLGTIKETEDQIIQVAFNGELAESTMFKDSFKVTVNDTEFEIQSATINSTDKSILEIKLKELIYSDDIINVSLVSDAKVISTDERELVAFEDASVQTYELNLLSDAIGGFEDGGLQWAEFTPAWGVNEGKIEFTKDRAFKGVYSMKMTSTGGQRLAVNTLPAEKMGLKFEAGKSYIFKYSIYLESSNVLPSELSMWFLGEWAKVSNPSPDQEKGKWITVTEEITPAADLDRLYFRVLPNATSDSDYTIYFDDLFIGEKDVRPIE